MRGYHIQIGIQRKRETHPQSYPGFETALPSDLFQTLPHENPRPTTRRSSIFNYSQKDYRLGPIRIDWSDFAMADSAGKGKDIGEGGSRGPSLATFVPIKGKVANGSTNLGEGIVHIFRDQRDLPASNTLEQSKADEAWDGVTVAVLAVPSWMTPSDFLAFTAAAGDAISHLRIVRDSVPNRSLTVLKFRDVGNAAEFIEEFNGKPFNSMDPEICHLVRVLSITIDPEDTISQSIERMGGTMYELPTCPVCLERMDSAVTGLITVPCSHTFHCMCLSKWGDSRCPVCRYSQNLLSSHPTSSSGRGAIPIPFTNPNSPTLSQCSSCSSTTNLWICLICGNIGCGRYGRAHAHAHYQLTTHLYALELETQRVWDYAGDGYVHRLIQNRADGKLVELPSAASSVGANSREAGPGPTTSDALTAEKIEAIGIEYSYLLTSQLDSQRAYYEEQATELTSQLLDLKQLVENLSKELQNDRKEKAELEMRLRSEMESKIAETRKDKLKLENRYEKMSELARKLDKELREERAVSDGLLKNLGVAKQKAETAEKDKQELVAKVEDLEEQLRDVIFTLEAKTRIEAGEGIDAEAAGGSLEIKVPRTSPHKKKSRK